MAPLNAYIHRISDYSYKGRLVAESREVTKPAAPWAFHLSILVLWCSVLFSKLGVLFSCIPGRSLSTAMCFTCIAVFLVSVYSLVQELEAELKSNTFVWEWDVCPTQALIQEELVLSANVSPARIRVRILKVTWNRPGFWASLGRSLNL